MKSKRNFTDDEIRAMHAESARGVSDLVLAKKYGCSYSVVNTTLARVLPNGRILAEYEKRSPEERRHRRGQKTFTPTPSKYLEPYRLMSKGSLG